MFGVQKGQKYADVILGWSLTDYKCIKWRWRPLYQEMEGWILVKFTKDNFAAKILRNFRLSKFSRVLIIRRSTNSKLFCLKLKFHKKPNVEKK